MPLSQGNTTPGPSDPPQPQARGAEGGHAPRRRRGAAARTGGSVTRCHAPHRAFVENYSYLNETASMPSSQPDADLSLPIEEYELPHGEALLAGTLALMTGYGQSLLAASPPDPRLAISQRIAANLESMSRVSELSPSFRALSERLSTLWHAMARCTAGACDGGGHAGNAPGMQPAAARLH